ncbi:unnamed protein product [Ceratitis capitata]|uniref:(Mediterranean fruit fly) hypothetical protein n=1 Tax=Ceratitis capitata TaxID=7213 RepID=A0A811UCB1_CERCA|nr:unnamed protein product [Ceratitis capitata]
MHWFIQHVNVAILKAIELSIDNVSVQYFFFVFSLHKNIIDSKRDIPSEISVYVRTCVCECVVSVAAYMKAQNCNAIRFLFTYFFALYTSTSSTQIQDCKHLSYHHCRLDSDMTAA